jgi:Ca2+/Na+ antiporter
MAMSSSGEDVLGRIISRDVAKAAREAAILYIVNTAIVIVFDFAIFLVGTPFLFFFRLSGYELITDSIATAITLYALATFLWARNRQNASRGVHFYLAGFLGLAVGGLLFSWGGWEFLSTGYWLRQYQKSGIARSPRDGGEIVAYGSESLVNKKTSRLVKIGYDYPRKWSYVGVPAAVIGYVLLALGNSFRGSFWFTITSRTGWILLIDGVSFVAMMVNQRAYLRASVRLPPDTGTETQSV